MKSLKKYSKIALVALSLYFGISGCENISSKKTSSASTKSTNTEQYLNDFCNSTSPNNYQIRNNGSCPTGNDSYELCCFLKNPNMNVMVYMDVNDNGTKEIFVQGQNNYYTGPRTNLNMLFQKRNNGFRKIFELQGGNFQAVDGKVDGYQNLSSYDSRYNKIIFQWNSDQDRYVPR
ncbi:MAG: hypothetical protein KJ623_04550 [Nanoarchaeota archaeon]|nr:hypothetical protein [Nanoarchaeota archaeon]